MGIGRFQLVLGTVAWELHRGANRTVEYLSRFGDGSYALYLIHIVEIAVVLHVVVALGIARSLSPIAMAFVLAPFLVWLGQVIYFRLEIPVMLFLKDRLEALGPVNRQAYPAERGTLP